MNRFGERGPRFWRHGRPRDDNREVSFRDRDYGFTQRVNAGRTAGDSERQPYPGERYGQREPYNARGGSERARWSSGPQPQRDDSSRYSESQYGYGPRRSQFDQYGDSYQAEFGEGPFADTSESPGYFGTGNYADGGASYTGGYDQRNRTRYPGSLGEDTMNSNREREQPRYRTGPKGYTRSDDRIREDISERLMMADSIDSSEVTITVKDGRVLLEGSVPTRSMKHSIEDLADYTAGVQEVENRIRVERQGQSSGSGSTTGVTSGVQIASGITPTAGLGKTRQ
jgi:osmotically-inducible protein OsmY